MRTCLNCKHKHKRLNISPCYQCIDTQTFIRWRSRIIHNIVIVTIELLLVVLLIASGLSVISSPYHDSYVSSVLHALFGGTFAGISLLALAYIIEREERRQNGN